MELVVESESNDATIRCSGIVVVVESVKYKKDVFGVLFVRPHIQ